MIKENLERILSQIPSSVKVIAVTKTHPVVVIQEAYEAGQRRFGENRVQELMQKKDALPRDIEWHMIGHLQTNKVKYIAPFIHLIHSVDSLKLLTEINKEGQKNNRVIDCLLQVYIAKEETKFGLNEDELYELLIHPSLNQMKHVRICGLMGIASFTSDREAVRKEFRFLASLFKKIKEKHFATQDYFCELSMGMSSDWQIAVEEGSTMIRIGTALFGERKYAQQ